MAGTSPSLPLARYAGTYADSAYGDAVVREEGEKLVVQFGRTTGDLEHWHYDTFQITWRTATRDRALATFRLDAKGAPVALSIPGIPELQRRAGNGIQR